MYKSRGNRIMIPHAPPPWPALLYLGQQQPLQLSAAMDMGYIFTAHYTTLAAHDY